MLQAHPGLMAASMPWLSGVDYKRLCTWFPYAALLLVLTRDRGSGRVTIGRDGLPRIHYWPDKHDRASMMKVSSLFFTHEMCKCSLCYGAVLLCRMLRALMCGEANAVIAYIPVCKGIYPLPL